MGKEGISCWVMYRYSIFFFEISWNLFSPLAVHDKQLKSKFQSAVTLYLFLINDQMVLQGIQDKCGTLYKDNFRIVIPEKFFVLIL